MHEQIDLATLAKQAADKLHAVHSYFKQVCMHHRFIDQFDLFAEQATEVLVPLMNALVLNNGILMIAMGSILLATQARKTF